MKLYPPSETSDLDAASTISADEILGALVDAVLVVDTNGIIRHASKAIESLSGYDHEELLGRPIEVLVPKGGRRIHARKRQQFAQSPSSRAMGVVFSPVLLRKDGIERPVDISLGVVHVGEQLWTLASIRDDEPRRQMEQEWRIQAELNGEEPFDVLYRTDARGVTDWVSDSIAKVLGWRAEDLVGTRFSELVVGADLDELKAGRDRLKDRETIDIPELRYRTKAGGHRWMSVRAQPISARDGGVVGSIVGLRDRQAEVQERRAHAALSAGSKLLIRAKDEEQLLHQMCETISTEGQYVCAFYARPRHDEERTMEVVTASGGYANLPDPHFSWGDGPAGGGPTGSTFRTGLTTVIHDVDAELSVGEWTDRASLMGFASIVSLPVRADGGLDGVLTVLGATARSFDAQSVEVLEDLAVQLGLGLERIREREQLVRLVEDQVILSTAIDNASDCVVVVDPAGVILYANPATLRTTGYSSAELVGQSSLILNAGWDDQLEDVRATVTAGRPWHGVLVGKKKNGEVFEESTSVTPILGPEGLPLAYVTIKHDLTVEQQLEGDLDREHGDRVALIEVMSRVQTSGTLLETSKSFCEAVSSLEAGLGAIILMALGDDRFLAVGMAGMDGIGIDLDTVIELPQGSPILEETSNGPWFRDTSRQVPGVPSEFVDATRTEGFSAVAGTSIRWKEELVGIFAILSRMPKEEWPGDRTRLSVIDELGKYAGAILGAQFEDHLDRVAKRSLILDVIENRRFHPVFQPVVDLGSGEIVGYEALTRFDDKVRPDLRFVEAHSVGLGVELEMVCVAEALSAASTLPSDLWLSMNFSPEAIITHKVADVIASSSRPIVIEITEHAVISDYAILRAAMNEMPGCRFSVDDAGAGYASFRHIIELRPDFVKLDISLTRSIDSDPTRQSLVTGMFLFTSQTGSTLIAEGLETKEQVDKILQLGVRLGQGYFLGRPAPLA